MPPAHPARRRPDARALYVLLVVQGGVERPAALAAQPRALQQRVGRPGDAVVTPQRRPAVARFGRLEAVVRERVVLL